MFDSLRRRKSSNNNSETSSGNSVPAKKQHFNWLGQAAFKKLGKLIDNSLSSVSEQIVDRIQNASYDIDLNNAKHETFANERYINQHRDLSLKPTFSIPSPLPTSNFQYSQEQQELKKVQDIQKIKQALSDYREQKKLQNNLKPVENTPKPLRKPIVRNYDNELPDNMN